MGTLRLSPLVARLRWGFWWTIRILFGLLLRVIQMGSRSMAANSNKLAIDSGAVSWGFIDYQELLASAKEYLGPEHVAKVVITDRERYLREVRAQIRDMHITHYFYDPRSASERCARSWFQAIGLALMLARLGITPIARLTDVPVRRWRAQTALVTAAQGTCLILMEPGRVRRWCVHRSLVGPLPMPLSHRTFESLNEIRAANPVDKGAVVFAGSLYEPRTSFLADLADRLRDRSIDLVLRTRIPGRPRTPNEEYWSGLASADVIFTTADQAFGSGIDRIDEPHLIYRYLEACAVGRPLVAQHIEGAEALFAPGEHFATYEDLDGAVEAIIRLLNEPETASRLAEAGLRRAEEIVEANCFWRSLDHALGGTLLGHQREESPPSTTSR